MSRLQGRLRKLEASIVDGHGLIPHTPRWLEYWRSQMHRLFAGEEMPGLRIPLEAVDAILADARSQRESD